MTDIFDATPLAERMLAAVAAQTARCARPPCLAIIQATGHAGAMAYTRRIMTLAETAGVHGRIEAVAPDLAPEAFLARIAACAASPDVDGVLIQFPLPPGVDRAMVAATLPPDKDVDCLHPLHLGRIVAGDPLYRPCTATAALSVAERLAGDLRGQHCLVIGASVVVGRPLALSLLDRGATVTIAHLDTRDIQALCRTADILFAAAGSAGLVRRDWVRKDAIVVDIGINRDPETGALVGDVLLEDAIGHARAITAVPNGVGPLTTAILIANTAQAACLRTGHGFTWPDVAGVSEVS